VAWTHASGGVCVWHRVASAEGADRRAGSGADHAPRQQAALA
jgi:hypothetical protein